MRGREGQQVQRFSTEEKQVVSDFFAEHIRKGTLHNQCRESQAPPYTVEPPNKGQVGAWALVHYSGVVLYWGVFVKKPFLCVVSVYS